MTADESAIQANIGLVHACVRKFVGRGIDYEDMFQAGCLGLVKAMSKFDETRGLKLSTYAVPVILGEIKSLFRYGGPVKVSRSLKELSVRIARESENFAKTHDRTPTISELSGLLSLEPEKISEAIGCSNPTESLSFGEEDCERQIPVESDEEKLTDSISLWQTIESLPDEDKKIISLRYYMNKTQRETADMIGASQVQVSRREKKILLYMRGVL